MVYSPIFKHIFYKALCFFLYKFHQVTLDSLSHQRHPARLLTDNCKLMTVFLFLTVRSINTSTREHKADIRITLPQSLQGGLLVSAVNNSGYPNRFLPGSGRKGGRLFFNGLLQLPGCDGMITMSLANKEHDNFKIKADGNLESIFAEVGCQPCFRNKGKFWCYSCCQLFPDTLINILEKSYKQSCIIMLIYLSIDHA